jgi:DNA mismatch endonuclease (patch repair protein)
LTRIPASNQAYWLPKLRRNVERDEKNLARLASGGWSCLVVWECELRDVTGLSERIRTFLG